MLESFTLFSTSCDICLNVDIDIVRLVLVLMKALLLISIRGGDDLLQMD